MGVSFDINLRNVVVAILIAAGTGKKARWSGHDKLPQPGCGNLLFEDFFQLISNNGSWVFAKPAKKVVGFGEKGQVVLQDVHGLVSILQLSRGYFGA